uniref:Uncharacterized protein n=1 Tax=Arundo donax TaxID=35708 RepID=A0A0A8YDJ1_ARUDO
MRKLLNTSTTWSSKALGTQISGISGSAWSINTFLSE